LSNFCPAIPSECNEWGFCTREYPMIRCIP
jgi:hypothetical protein